jgi:hypothetical protein
MLPSENGAQGISCNRVAYLFLTLPPGGLAPAGTLLPPPGRAAGYSTTPSARAEDTGREGARLGPRQGERERRAVMRWRGPAPAARVPAPASRAAHPERCVEAYYLQRTRFERDHQKNSDSSRRGPNP